MKPLEPIIQTERLSHIYSAGTPFEHGALVDVDFTAYRGEYLGIIGHTGSGQIHPHPAPQRAAQTYLRPRPLRGPGYLGEQGAPAKPASRWDWCFSTQVPAL